MYLIGGTYILAAFVGWDIFKYKVLGWGRPKVEKFPIKEFDFIYDGELKDGIKIKFSPKAPCPRFPDMMNFDDNESF